VGILGVVEALFKEKREK